MTEAQRQAVLAEARSERFVDRSPEHIVTTLLEEGKYFCSIRTLYRLLAKGGETTPRRRQRNHPPYRRPELMANVIAETYTYAPDGTISVQIANLTRGYARTFELGALR